MRTQALNSQYRSKDQSSTFSNQNQLPDDPYNQEEAESFDEFEYSQTDEGSRLLNIDQINIKNARFKNVTNRHVNQAQSFQVRSALHSYRATENSPSYQRNDHIVSDKENQGQIDFSKNTTVILQYNPSQFEKEEKPRGTQTRAYQRIIEKTQKMLNSSRGAQQISGDEDQQDKVYRKMFNKIQNNKQGSAISANKRFPSPPTSSLVLKDQLLKQQNIDRDQLKALTQSCSQRLLKNGETYKLKREIMHTFERVSQVVDCTFQPSINKSQSPARDLETFVKDQQTSLLIKQRKINEMAQQKEEEELSKIQSHRMMSKGSEKIIQKVNRSQRSNSPLQGVHFLYQKGKEKLSKQTEEQKELKQYLNQKASTQLQRQLMSAQSLKDIRKDQPSKFQPEINVKSKLIKRKESIESLLYKDALKRQEDSKERRNSRSSANSSLSREKKTGKKSEDLVAQNFRKEFNQVLIIQNEEQEFEQRVLYQLIGMGFVSDISAIQGRQLAQDLQILAKDSNLNDNLMIILGAIVNLNLNQSKRLSVNNNTSLNQNSQNNTVSEADDDYMIQNSSLLIKQAKNKLIQQLSNPSSFENGCLALNDSQVKAIHQAYLALHYNRQKFLQTKSKISPFKKDQNENHMSFQPQIGAKSKKLADKVISKIKSSLNTSKHHEYLISAGKKIQIDKENKAKSKRDSELEKCSFRPFISTNSKNIAAAASEKASPKQQEQSKDKFVALYSDYKNKQLRQDRTTEQVEYERSLHELTFHPNKDKKSPLKNQNLSHYANRKTTQDGLQEIILRQEPRKQAAYVIGIELEGINYKMNIYEGDRPEEVLNSFCKNKKLNDNVYQKIVTLIREQMSQSLTSISEDRDQGSPENQ